MYAWVWRHVPGPWPARLLVFFVLVAVIAYTLFVWGFPWAEDAFNVNDVTVG